jgi:hypothetical protein
MASLLNRVFEKNQTEYREPQRNRLISALFMCLFNDAVNGSDSKLLSQNARISSLDFNRDSTPGRDGVLLYATSSPPSCPHPSFLPHVSFPEVKNVWSFTSIPLYVFMMWRSGGPHPEGSVRAHGQVFRLALERGEGGRCIVMLLHPPNQ